MELTGGPPKDAALVSMVLGPLDLVSDTEV